MNVAIVAIGAVCFIVALFALLGPPSSKEDWPPCLMGVGILLLAWFLLVLLSNKPERTVGTYPVQSLKCPDGTEMQVIVTEAGIMNINSRMGVQPKPGSVVLEVSHKDWYWGMHWTVAENRFKVVQPVSGVEEGKQ